MVRFYIGEFLHCAAGPADCHPVDPFGLADPEVSPEVALGEKTGPGGDFSHLDARTSDHFDARADSIPIALSPDGGYFQPVLSVAAVVAQERRSVVDVQDQDIQISVFVVVADGRSPTDFFHGESAAGLRSDLHKAPVARILEEERVAGFAYGESSIFHVYLEAYPGSGASSAEELRTSDPTVLKGMPAALIAALHKNLQIRGVKLLSYNGGVTSSAHTVDDIDKTLGVVREVLTVLRREQLVAPLGGA